MKSLFKLKSPPSVWTQDIKKYLTNLVFLVCNISYRTLFFFLLRFMTYMTHTWAINPSRKDLVCNLQCRPQTWSVRSIFQGQISWKQKKTFVIQLSLQFCIYNSTFPVCKCPAKTTFLIRSGLSIKSAKYLQWN